MANKPLIFSTHSLHSSIVSQLSALGDLQIASLPTPGAIDNESGGAEFIVVRAAIDPKIVERERGLRALIRHGAGLDMIPVDTCTAHGVLVANVPGVNAITVAEHAIWTAMALLRKYPKVNTDLRKSGWESGRGHANDGLELSGRTIGIVGMGNVGKSIAKIAMNGFAMNVLTTTKTPANVPTGINNVSLHKLLSSSDVIVLCCPLNEETRGLIGRDQLGMMRSESVLVNVARGPVIDQAALVETLAQNRIRGAALDVFDTHPLPDSHPLYACDNVILTPHMAGITSESMLRMGQGVVDEITRIMAGNEPVNFINPGALDLYRRRFGNYSVSC